MSLSLDLDVWSERAELLDTTWYWLECSPDQQKPHCSLVSLGNPQPITLCIVEPGSGYVVQGSPEEIEYSYTLSASAICSASSAWSAAPLQLVRPSQSQEALRLDFILEPPTQSLDYWRVSESSGSDQVDFLNEQRSRDQEGVLMTVSDMRLYVRSPQPHAYMWSQCCDAYTTFSYYVLAISGAITIKDSKTEIFCVGHARGPSEEDCPPDWQEVLHVKPYTLCQDEIHMTMA
ncbi:hypothetical protein E5Q_03549 [Mixia osmundae IAM 14324]|uniref:Uncharacterized protein n=1 Tax=Mixia osmundae (strain CBS 9802 / IAM 14324 / JCM 22182 / KY 12970) TaxID=764103 RepID=G7E1W3_MIXOS|nr:hypothetical protein E5Q_03549 [Mixia osmundae IAM 14324]